MISTILKNLLTKGLLTKRWNNYPKIEEVSILDNTGFAIHIALFIVHLEGGDLDEEYIIKKMIFSLFSTTILSDINTGTKNQIKKFDKEIFEKLENKSLSYILSFDAPENLKKDIKNTINDKNHKKEDLIINASKKIAGLFEAEVNAKIFDYIYKKPLQEINLSLENLSKEISSIDEILSNKHYYNYLEQLRRLSYCMRWNQQSRKFPISVMSHLVIITFINYVLLSFEKNSSFDKVESLKKTLYHDIPEAITGDIITPTKKGVPGFEEILEKVEYAMMEDALFCHISNDYKQKIIPLMLDPFSNKNGKLAKMADILSAYFEAKIEVLYGSKNYKIIEDKIFLALKEKYSGEDIDFMLNKVGKNFESIYVDDINLEDF
ncbi:HD domain-containing protein [Candidatus Gracilibacteria bacterium]|nr:HD domain-containing protein [Candidatus Gracilibacteria bacterium]